MPHCPQLTPRLQAVADMVGECKTLADIGTDHAYLPVHLLKTGSIQRAIASDIRQGPIARAQSTIERYHETDRIETRLGAGMTILRTDEADTVVIAGMGGILIANILQESEDLLTENTNLILQPMTAMRELREYLSSHNFRIVQEVLAKEENKLYHVMKVTRGTELVTDLTELYLGKRLLEVRPPYFEEYLAGRARALRTAAEGMAQANSENSKQKLEEYRYLLGQIERIQKGEKL